MEFFKYDYYANENFNIYERIIPIIVLLIIIAAMIVSKIKHDRNNIIQIKSKSRLKKIKLYLTIFYGVTFISDYVFLYSQFGIDRYSLPLELCTYGAILSMIALMTNNKRIIYFLETVSLPAAFMAIANPVTGGTYKHLQYYLFMINHGLTILIPTYFIVIKQIIPNIKQIVISIGYLTIIAGVTCIFNNFLGTTYFFISCNENPCGSGLIASLGEAPFYIIKLVLLGYGILLSWGAILLLIGKLQSNKAKQTAN